MTRLSARLRQAAVLSGLIAGLVLPGLSGCSQLATLNLMDPEDVPFVSCPDTTLCLDDAARVDEARALYESAYDYVNALPGGIKTKPRVVFCSTQDCFERFGQSKSAATTLGTIGIVISPKGWKSFYLRHEMIHHQQSEQLGFFKQLTMPEWFREGMAYELSKDPRPVLAQPLEQYRQNFRNWNGKVEADAFWDAASKL